MQLPSAAKFDPDYGIFVVDGLVSPNDWNSVAITDLLAYDYNPKTK